MSKVLVVGGGGYVGAVLVEELLAQGYAVRILDRLYYGRQGLCEVEDRVEVVVDDMRTVDASILEGIDAVINVGGLSNDPTAEYNPRANYEMNTSATGYLANLCKRAGVRRFVFASSCSIYDRGVADGELDIVQDEASPVDPKAAYSKSKFEAEQILRELADDDFCPVILRKGTIYGFSPRMRYDLVVNTFVKDALSKRVLRLHFGGEMWRPLVDIRDAARAYIACLQAEESLVRGEIFNISQGNYRISELALRVRKALSSLGISVEIRPDYGYRGVRSYRVSARKIEHTLGFKPLVSVEESACDMVRKIEAYGYSDFDNPRYYNIRWMKVLEESLEITKLSDSVFEAPKAAVSMEGEV